MNKLVLATLAAFSTCSYAETHPYDGKWTQITRDQDAGSTVYAEYQYDANSFQRNGATVTFWEKMIVADTHDGTTFVSLSQEIINCETQQQAQVAFVSPAGPNGTLLSPEHMLQKAPVFKAYPPNSPAARVMRFMCKIGT
jgi:hypothetical protein